MNHQTTSTAQKRSELIGRHLGVSRPFSAAASEINDQLQLAIADIGNLEPAEQARLLSALMVQVSGKLAGLHGCR